MCMDFGTFIRHNANIFCFELLSTNSLNWAIPERSFLKYWCVMCEALGFEEGAYSKDFIFLCQGHGGAFGNIWGCCQGDQLVNIRFVHG